MKHVLYGDGIHDDFDAIQEMLDSGTSCVYLPCPRVCYKISKCLKIHSHQELKLDRYTLISLMDNSNCAMAENYDPENWDSDICITGGIWDMNHNAQWPNPYHFDNPVTGRKAKDFYENVFLSKRDERLFFKEYSGHCFRFNSIKNFTFRNLTIRNPVVYGCQMAYIDGFTVENIVFDYTEGSPKLWNLDGIHLEGGCRNGVIRNLRGTCHDDLLAITADDGKFGIVENITVDGIVAEGCHSAVRLLSWHIPVRNVHISNIFCTFYVYCITLSKYYGTNEDRGSFENITIDHISASFCKGTVDVVGNDAPLIGIGGGLDIDSLSIGYLSRTESVCSMPTIGIDGNTSINFLHIHNCFQNNLTDETIEFLKNKADIKYLRLENNFSEGL